jgi:cell division protein FtsN
MESALSEARTLELLNIPTEVEREGPRFRVVLGRFSSFEDAERVRTRYRAKGHDFLIVAR